MRRQCDQQFLQLIGAVERGQLVALRGEIAIDVRGRRIAAGQVIRGLVRRGGRTSRHRCLRRMRFQHFRLGQLRRGRRLARRLGCLRRDRRARDHRREAHPVFGGRRHQQRETLILRRARHDDAGLRHGRLRRDRQALVADFAEQCRDACADRAVGYARRIEQRLHGRGKRFETLGEIVRFQIAAGDGERGRVAGEEVQRVDVPAFAVQSFAAAGKPRQPLRQLSEEQTSQFHALEVEVLREHRIPLARDYTSGWPGPGFSGREAQLQNRESACERAGFPRPSVVRTASAPPAERSRSGTAAGTSLKRRSQRLDFVITSSAKSRTSRARIA